jgi:hypothetical protein
MEPYPMSLANQSDVERDVDPLAQEMTAISLEQALRDFEVANARVIDLTTRLVTVSRELDDVEAELAPLRRAVTEALARAEAAEHALAAIKASRSVRVALLAGRVVRRIAR